ncbi:MAG: Ig-like domain-containing protein, partial [Gemmatimonadota bacterium]
MPYTSPAHRSSGIPHLLAHRLVPPVALALLGALSACGDDGPTGPSANGDGTDEDPVPTAVEAASDTLPSGTVGEPLADVPTVVVLDADGDPVSGVSVGWSVSAGSLSAESVESDADGRASVDWTLGEAAGEQTATASVDGLGSVEFTATAAPGPAASVAFGSESYSLEVEGSAELAVTFEDAYGNIVDGDDDDVELAWSTTDEAIVTVDEAGVISAGTEPGEAEVVAALDAECGGEGAPDDGAADTATVVVGAGPAVAFTLAGPDEAR